ncbi:MAG: glycosyltransferase [Burkholderiales bacterium]|nr:glycosyltransferase [Burkholderiales bacterium]
MSRPRALLVATSYPRDASDWKGRFIYDQAAALARQGIAVRIWAPPGELPAGVETALTAADAHWLEALLAQGGIAHLLRRKPWTGTWAGWQLLRRLGAACRRLPETDFYLINWLQNSLALPDDGIPAIVTVLGSDFALLRLPGMAAALRRQCRLRPMLLAPNAGWMVPRLRKLFGDVAEVESNPFGVAREWFSVERGVERNGWLVVSRITRAKLGTLAEWGEGLFSPSRPLHLLGPLQEDIALPPWVIHHGATNPGELCARWFPQATGLLTLSRHDEGRPQVMIEAMAAGLPVVASHIRAHADLVRDNVTGWLVDDRAALAAALDAADDPVVAARVGAAARDYVIRQIGTWDDCAARYAVASRNLLERKDAR